ncbi:MAG: hypothetical protein RL685_3373, partial [Pseudomonadota bacterium]
MRCLDAASRQPLETLFRNNVPKRYWPNFSLDPSTACWERASGDGHLGSVTTSCHENPSTLVS